MARTACTEPQCLYKGDLYLYLFVIFKYMMGWLQYVTVWIHQNIKVGASCIVQSPFFWWTVKVDHLTSGDLWCMHQLSSLACSDTAYQRGFRVPVAHPQWLCGFLHDIMCVLHTLSTRIVCKFWWKFSWFIDSVNENIEQVAETVIENRFHLRQRTCTECVLT
jgi:hypothetical protein